MMSRDLVLIYISIYTTSTSFDDKLLSKIVAYDLHLGGFYLPHHELGEGEILLFGICAQYL